MNTRPAPFIHFAASPLMWALIGLCTSQTIWAAEGLDKIRLAANAQGQKAEELAQSLNGYNYVIKTGASGQIESVSVSGENGSGANNQVTAGGKIAIAQADVIGIPRKLFKENMRGTQAIEALGANLPDVAAAHGMSPERFKEILQEDDTAWVDVSGRMYYVETPPHPPEQGVGVTDSAPIVAKTAALDLSKTFLLHSRPGSTKVIYLDFNGQTVTGTAWNSYAGKATLEAPPFDLTGNPAVFDNAELERIQYIWQRVAEDYAAFDVDVTTAEPTAAALDRTSASDQTFGTRAVITKNVLGCSCGGIAYVGVFDYGSTSYKPAWVFYDMLGGGNEKYVAEAVSHEIGHNLGLSHDGTASFSYYQGHGTGAAGWAPIMGVGYYKELVEWSQGEYPGANNKEDDFSIIQTHGAIVRADDAGNTTTTAATLSGTANGTAVSIDRTGNIEQRHDVDYYVFNTSGGTVNLSITPAPRGPNLDISAGLYNAAGGVLIASNPVDTLNATLSTTLTAGTYYLKVDGGGKTAIATDSGYTDYGSLGQYQIRGSFTQAATSVQQQPPVAVATTSTLTGYSPLPVSFSSANSRDDGTIVAYTWNFGDNTATSNEPNPLHTYTSAGTYTAKLTVTDNGGLTASSSVTVTVKKDPTPSRLRVGKMAIGLVTIDKTSQATAYVLVTNGMGQVVNNATVVGKWSSLAKGTSKALSNASGVAALRSPTSKSVKGTFTFTVTGISLRGYTYAPGQNAKTAISISK